MYTLNESIPAPAGTRIDCVAHYDNSADNPNNPAPDEWVHWGDQTWEEMAVAFFEISEPLDRSGGSIGSRRKVDPKARQKKIDAYIKRVFDKLDTNGDGVIRKSETPIVVKFFNFHNVDRDANGTLTRDEVRRIAETIY